MEDGFSRWIWEGMSQVQSMRDSLYEDDCVSYIASKLGIGMTIAFVLAVAAM